MHGLIISCFLEYQYGGAEFVTRQLARMLPLISDRPVTVEALCLAGGRSPLKEVKAHRVFISRVFHEGASLAAVMKRYILFFSSAAQDRQWERKLSQSLPDLSRFDFVHCCDQHWLSAAAGLARRHRKPLLFTSHDNLPRELFPGQTLKPVERFLNARLQKKAADLLVPLSACRAITAPSRACLGTIRQFMEEHETNRPSFEVTENWIEEYLLPGPATPAPRTLPRIFFAGRLSREKGVDLLLRAHARVPEFGLTVIGSNGPLEAEVKQLAERSKPEQFTWIPKLPHQQMIDEMRRHALVVLPSRFNEPFGKTILEARLSQVPVLTTTAGGIPEILEDYPSSALLNHQMEESAFVADLAAGIRRLMNQTYIEETPIARSAFLRRYAPAAGVLRYRDLYERWVAAPNKVNA